MLKGNSGVLLIWYTALIVIVKKNGCIEKWRDVLRIMIIPEVY